MIGAILGLLGYSALQVVGYTAFLPQIQKSLEKNKGKANFWSVLFAPALAFDSVFNGRESLSAGNQKKALEKIKKKQAQAKELLKKRAKAKLDIFKSKKLKEKYGPEVLKELENKMNELIDKDENFGKSEKEIFGNMDNWLENKYQDIYTTKTEPKIKTETLKEKNEHLEKEEKEIFGNMDNWLENKYQDIYTTKTEPKIKTETLKEKNEHLEKEEKELYEKIEDYFKLYKMVIKGDEIALANFKNKDELNGIYNDYLNLSSYFARSRSIIEEKYPGKENQQTRENLLREAKGAYNKSLMNFMLEKNNGISRLDLIGYSLNEVQKEFQEKLENKDNTLSIDDVVALRKDLNNFPLDQKIEKMLLNKKYLETLDRVTKINELKEKKNNNQISEEEEKELNESYYTHSFEQNTLKEINNTFGFKDYLEDINQLKESSQFIKDNMNDFDKISSKYQELELIPLNDYERREKCEKDLKAIVKDLYAKKCFQENEIIQAIDDKRNLLEIDMTQLNPSNSKIKQLTKEEIEELHSAKIYNHLVNQLNFNRIKNLNEKSINGKIGSVNKEIVDFPLTSNEKEIINYLSLKKKMDEDYKKLSFGNLENYNNYQNYNSNLQMKEQELYEAEIAPNVLEGLKMIVKNVNSEVLMPYNDLEKSLNEFSSKNKEEIDSGRYNISEKYGDLYKKIASIKAIEVEDKGKVEDKNKIDVDVKKYEIDQEKIKGLELTTGQQRIVDCLNELYKDGIVPSDVFDKRSLNALKRKGLIKEEEAGRGKFEKAVYNSCAIYSKPIYITVQKGKAIAVMAKTLHGKEIPVNKISKEYVSQETIELLKKDNKDLAMVLENKSIEKERIDINSTPSR